MDVLELRRRAQRSRLYNLLGRLAKRHGDDQGIRHEIQDLALVIIEQHHRISRRGQSVIVERLGELVGLRAAVAVAVRGGKEVLPVVSGDGAVKRFAQALRKELGQVLDEALAEALGLLKHLVVLLIFEEVLVDFDGGFPVVVFDLDIAFGELSRDALANVAPDGRVRFQPGIGFRVLAGLGAHHAVEDGLEGIEAGLHGLEEFGLHPGL